ncbi:MAG: hypothetical protein ACI87E_004774 [Mariniblastus sp.]|jgi:hypothetical protein
MNGDLLDREFGEIDSEAGRGHESSKPGRANYARFELAWLEREGRAGG